jgi:hypothetical protein
MHYIARGFFTALHVTAIGLCAFGIQTLWAATPTGHPVLMFLALLSMLLAGVTASIKVLTRWGFAEGSLTIQLDRLTHLWCVVLVLMTVPFVLIIANLQGAFVPCGQPAQQFIGLALSYAWFLAFDAAGRAVNAYAAALQAHAAASAVS